MDLTPHQLQLQRPARRGTGNGNRMRVPLWEELVRTGEIAHAVRVRSDQLSADAPGWSFDRFGMSRTRLPDDRIICIAGEHEDYYDPDFFIYNDVVVIQPGGGIEIYGYTPDVFPPTDFHTAAYVGDAIYVIGCLGYGEQRGAFAPVFRLDPKTMRMEHIATSGEQPAWISRHRAELMPDGRTIYVSGGKIRARLNGKEELVKSPYVGCFDTKTSRWSRSDAPLKTTGITIDDLPPGWAPIDSPTEAKELRDAIVRAAAPDHPLFCDDFWPVAVSTDRPGRVMVRMDDEKRWAICDQPSYTGREEPPLPVRA